MCINHHQTHFEAHTNKMINQSENRQALCIHADFFKLLNLPNLYFILSYSNHYMTDTSQKLELYCRQDSNILEGKKHKKFVVRKLKRLVLRDKHIQKSSVFFLLVTLKPHKFLTFLVRPHLSIARGNIKASIFCFFN